ncbi:hypothetical protein [Nocardia brasiliensis]|uniref:hypothetical protein n=1 Tax=Nocardia brasiliensis TaxID=37326 RepID=UPI0024544CD1|nr:hypothetical protein [Nocardia brasiliensis]
MSQLVYFQIPAQRRQACAAFANGGVIDRPRHITTRVLVGELAQFDECEDEVDPDSQVPVRYRGRVMAAPLHAIRPVL